MEDKKIITVNGEEVLQSLCRKINNEYYKVGDITIENSGDCYYITNKYVRITSGFLVYNHTQKKYVRKSKYDLIEGVVNFSDDGKIIMGYFESDDNKAIIELEDKTVMVFDEELIPNRFYKEHLSTGIYYKYNAIRSDRFNKIKKPSQNYKISLTYDSRPVIDKYIKDYNNIDIKISDNVKKYSKYLKDLTFGVEFETSSGFIPSRFMSKSGLIPLRDGSITGLEYVTVPLQSEKGLQTLINSTKLLKRRTEIDKDCSLHYHIGNIPRTKEFFVAFYKTIAYIQDSLFELYPLYKKYNFDVKRKNYTKPLPVIPILGRMDYVINDKNIDDNFNILFKYLSCGISYKNNFTSLDQVMNHPNDPNGTSKWNIHSRYTCINMIPLLFGNKQTIEFRLSTASLDVNNIVNTLFMYSSIINFVKENTQKILQNYEFIFNYDLSNIISATLNTDDNSYNLYKNIQSFINNRKSHSFREKCDGDIVGNEVNVPMPTKINWNNDEDAKKLSKLKFSILEDLVVNNQF